MKIVICSDNHGNDSVLERIVAEHPNADYYWHLGDSEAFTMSQLKPFTSVRGNNDFLFELPISRVMEIGDHRFLLIHGTGILPYDLSPLVEKAKSKECDVVIFGHIHRPVDEIIDGIRLINPGSCNHNRSYAHPTYAIINIDKDNELDLEFIDC